MPKRVLYLIRNGEYNTAHTDRDGNAPLTETGAQQSTRTGRALRDLPIQQIFTSPHQQTYETAEIIAQAFGDIGLYENDELKQYNDVSRTFANREALMRAMEENTHEQQIEQAFQRFFRPAVDADVHQAIVCHANIIIDLICRATNVNPDMWSHMLINNCAINIISIEDADNMQLVAFNDIRHLPENMRTE